MPLGWISLLSLGSWSRKKLVVTHVFAGLQFPLEILLDEGLGCAGRRAHDHLDALPDKQILGPLPHAPCDHEMDAFFRQPGRKQARLMGRRGNVFPFDDFLVLGVHERERLTMSKMHTQPSVCEGKGDAKYFLFLH